ncbi:MAG TPA: DUF6249 domain-containing protein [Chitinophagaceae bacterium]|nr:DUF6249 domain-containing protein [Chitinophagaceae bacterium]
MHGTEMMAAILIPLTFCALIFGIVYLIKRENLAMIEKGLNPKEFANRPAPYKNLKWGLLLIGAGTGLFLAYMLDTYALPHYFNTEIFNGNTYRHRSEDSSPAVYFALIAIGGGLGLFGSYKMEKKWWDENKEKQ